MVGRVARPSLRPQTGNTALGIGMGIQGGASLVTTIADAAQGLSLKKLRAEQTAANAAFKNAEANVLLAQAQLEKASASAAQGVAFLETTAQIESQKTQRSRETNLTGFALAGLALAAVFLLIRR